MDITGQRTPRQLRAVVLAAGSSSRMGACKALLDWHGAPLLTRHLAVLRTVTSDIRVVVGAHALQIGQILDPGLIVHNAGWAKTEMIDSLRLALRGWEGSAVVQPVDIPPPSRMLLEALCEVGGTAVPVHEGSRGHPIVLGRAEVARLGSAQTLRHLLVDAVEVPGPGSCLLDFDDPDALERARQAYPNPEEDVGG